MPHVYKDAKAIQSEATLIGQALVKAKYVGPITIEFVCWEEMYLTTAWVTSIKLFYTPTRDQFNLSKLAARDVRGGESTIMHQPAPDTFPKFRNLKRLKYFDTSDHFRTYRHNPVKSSRAVLYLGRVRNTGSKHLSKEGFMSLFSSSQKDVNISKEVCCYITELVYTTVNSSGNRTIGASL